MLMTSRWKNAIAALLGTTIALQPIIATAAIHQLSFVKSDSPTLQTLDLVASTDFDYDSATPTVTAAGTTLNRAYLNTVFAAMAEFMFTMTEGRHRVGTIYVYRNNRFSSNVDMKILGIAPGRSNANPAGFGKRGATSNNYVAYSATIEESAADLGKTIAHEHGHYIYGLFDEYREEGRPLGEPAQPAQTDTPTDTLMANQRQFGTFSTAGDFTATTQVAQKRIYGVSAWETLSRPPSADPAAIQGLDRTAFAAFAGFSPASQAALTKPVVGWDGAYKVEFVPDPAVTEVYVISKKLTADQLTGVKNAVVMSLRQLTLDARTFVSVVTYPGVAATPAYAMQALDTEAKRTAAIAAVEAITVDTTAADLTQTLDAILTDINARYTANNLKLGDAISLNVFAGDQDAISVAVRQRVKDLRVAVNASIVTFDGIQPGSSAKRAVAVTDLAKNAMRAKVTAATTTVTLAQLAHASGGHFTDAHRISALTIGAMKAQEASSGLANTSLASKHVNSLAVGAPFEVKTPVLAKTDGKLTFTAAWANDSDNGRLRYELSAPDGTSFVPSNPLANQTFGGSGEVKYVFDAEANSAEFEVAKSYSGRNGVWTSRVVASAAVASPIEQEVEAESTLRAEIDVIGDGSANPSIAVTLATDRAVQGAAAVAVFYGADGAIKLTKTLLDDGTGGDQKAGDGTYTAQLGGLLAAGQYDVVVTLVDGPGGASFSTAGSTIKGLDAAREAVGGAFSRTADAFLTIAPTLVVEYYVPSLKKYFITGRESEKATLAQFPAIYTLTGMNFVAGPGAAPPAGNVPICRYYFSPPLANTHFYGGPADCALVASAFAGNTAAKNEGVDFAIATPDAAGTCPASAPMKIYRSFNNRSAQNDGNHRYTVSTARYDQMAAAGYSRDGVVFCAAAVTDSAQ